MSSDKCTELINDLKAAANPTKATLLQRFFKTGKGQYAEGDIFWGLTASLARSIARKHKNLDLAALEKLLTHKVHDVRLCTLLIMVHQAQTKPEHMYKLYLDNTKFINNWDLVDLSAPTLVGNYLLDKDCAILRQLAQSSSLWERRIAIIATFAFIKQGHHEHTLELARLLMQDKHDLIHKAGGWMLREVGKRCSTKILENFLDQHAANMPRTMLRYALEHLPPNKKKYYMQAKSKKEILL
jgi:3-methyladenine DNA glycosylase AlkD